MIFNNDMDDFSVPGKNNSYGYPPTPANYIRPKHRALSSMSPTIVLKNNKVAMTLGASGGSMIPTAVAQVLYTCILTYYSRPFKLCKNLTPKTVLYLSIFLCRCAYIIVY